jgi:hypothetical protein
MNRSTQKLMPVQQRITFKLCRIWHSNAFTSANLSRMCSSVAMVPTRAGLRSAVYGHLLIPGARMSTMTGVVSITPVRLLGTLFHQPSMLTVHCRSCFQDTAKGFPMLLAWLSSTAHL